MREGTGRASHSHPAMIVMVTLLATTRCSSSFHGSYAPVSYIAEGVATDAEPIGKVEGNSCQRRILYLFPMGESVSTSEAIQAAKEAREGTRYLADISIDDNTHWLVGYLEQCITVKAMAY